MSPSSNAQDNGVQGATRDPNPPTVAAFSPATLSGSSITSRQRSSVIVHRKSPLLVATPPPVTRALAYSHPFILPLNKLVGLLSWSTGDPWESFLLVAAFWAIVLYGDAIILWAGPILAVLGLIFGMYSRRYSPLSSAGVAEEKPGHKSRGSESTTRHHKSLDEILETMREFTTRCNILLEPLFEFTNFLSTQRTPTSASTRPALTVLFIRILCVTPLWILLTLPPFCIITFRRVILALGTVILTYHSRPARVSRVILWRSLRVRRVCWFITGLSFSLDISTNEQTKSISQSDSHTVDIAKTRRPDSFGIRFTFIVYENQRRWLGIGWTYSLLAYERSAWTDEHLNSVPSKDNFELPEVKGGNATWRWVEKSEWRIDGADDSTDGGGWIYYDNKWQDGRRGQDGWGRYTRRRKWFRDAELVEIPPAMDNSLDGATSDSVKPKLKIPNGTAEDDAASTSSVSPTSNPKRRRWFGGSKDGKGSISLASVSAATAVSSSANADTISLSSGASSQAVSMPITIHKGRSASLSAAGRASSYDIYGSSPGQKSVSSSRSRKRFSVIGVNGADCDSLSLRNKEIEEAENRLNHWGTRASDGTERAEREMGLSDDINMGLS